MLKNIPQVPLDKVLTAEWHGDPLEYDLQLYTLGEGEEEFWVLNPEFEGSTIPLFITDIPESRKCIVFNYNGEWVAKLFKDGWYPYHGYDSIEIPVPKLSWARNPEIDSRMTFDIDPRQTYSLDFWDQDYEMYWAMDPRFFPYENKVWVYKTSVIGKKTSGTKFMGYLTPNVKVERNTVVDFLDLDQDDLFPPYYELDSECVFVLDNQFTGNEIVEIMTVTPAYKKPVGRKIAGIITPEVNVKVNPKLKDINFDLNSITVYYEDLNKENIWMLDHNYLGPEDTDLWAIKISASDKPRGKKVVGEISPTFHTEFNPDLGDLTYNVDIKIPWYDLKYEHMWMLDSKHTRDLADETWAVKISATDNVVGTKIVGSIEPCGELEINGDVTVPFVLPENFAVQYYDFSYEHVWLSREGIEKIQVARLCYVEEPEGRKEFDITSELNEDQLDVIFISYNEPNAENNWHRVKEKAPWAQRVDGVKGILNAHKAAAKIARTDMFYVVDGDAHLVDSWKFNYRPSIFDRDCTYIWAANNPLTDLTYGHGGVKLFSKEKILKLKKWRTLDMTTCVSEKIKVMSEVSNVTEFNTDDFNSWKTAFRECVKLCLNVQTDHANENHSTRLEAWQHINPRFPFAESAIAGAQQAIEFFKENEFDASALTKINDRDWLEQRFEETYKKNI